MYVYELAMELGLAATDLVSRAALLGLGPLEPISQITPQQEEVLRNTVLGAIAAHPSPGFEPAADGGVPPAAEPLPPLAPLAPLAPVGQVPPLSFAPPLDPDVPGAPTDPPAPSPFAAGGEPVPTPMPPRPPPPPPMGQPAPLSFAPGSTSSPSPAMSFGGGEAPPPPPPAPSSGFDGAAQDDDGTWLSTMPPSTDASPATDKLWAAIGAAVVVLLVVVGAVVLLSGGKDSKSTLVAISIPTGPQAGDIPFGASGGKNPQFISDIGEFCDGYKYLHEFQVGFETKLTKAKSMSSFGAWYDANDGFGNAGLGRMEGSFRPTSRPPLERIRRYLAMLDDVARMNSVSQAKIQLISETAPYLDEIEAINEVAGQHC